MSNLVIMKYNQAVTSTVNVAGDFEREHYDVIKSVERLKEDVGTFSEMFFETHAPDSYGRNRKIYLMNRDGFTLLVMGFTGKAAMKFKLDYMNAFNEMEKKIQHPRVLNDKEQLMASMKLSIEANEKLENHDERITYLEETMRIDGLQARKLQNKGKSIVIECLEGLNSNAYQKLSRKTFSAIWRDFKNHFGIPRYDELPCKQYEEGIRFLGMWQPSTSLRIEIQELNNQQVMEGVF